MYRVPGFLMLIIKETFEFSKLKEATWLLLLTKRIVVKKFLWFFFFYINKKMRISAIKTFACNLIMFLGILKANWTVYQIHSRPMYNTYFVTPFLNHPHFPKTWKVNIIRPKRSTNYTNTLKTMLFAQDEDVCEFWLST